VIEHVRGTAPRRLSDVPAAGCGTDGTPCAVGCCEPPMRPVSAAPRLG